MKKNRGWILSLFLFFLVGVPVQAEMFHTKNVRGEWKEEDLSPFDELMITWNAERPAEGAYLFYVSVKTDAWSPWLAYASWGSEGQKGFHSPTEEAPVRVYQDAVELLEGKKAVGFQVKIVPEGGASLEGIHQLHVYTNSDHTLASKQEISYSEPVFLDVPRLSQMVLDHPRHADLCSPTATAAVSRYLSGNHAIDPVSFAQRSWDGGFDIYGNWVFNVAHASSLLGRAWCCWVERLSSFDEIYRRLHQGTPVVVSVRGPLSGSAQPYAKGHLMAVIGFDPIEQRVLCMDSAFSSDEETHVSYPVSDFVEAWTRRGKVAYLFSKKE